MNYSGGDNRTHGQVERAQRIDSFEAGKMGSWGVLYAFRGNAMTPLGCEHYTDYGPGDLESEAVDLSYPRSRWTQTLPLTRIPNGFGGSRAFWLCPCCGRRVRYLYFKDLRFICRECARLNYRSQQRTRDSTNHARDGLKLAQDKLHWDPPFSVAPVDFPFLVPEKPKGMHWSTYKKYLDRFRQYQAKYKRDSLREMLSILRR